MISISSGAIREPEEYLPSFSIMVSVLPSWPIAPAKVVVPQTGVPFGAVKETSPEKIPIRAMGSNSES